MGQENQTAQSGLAIFGTCAVSSHFSLIDPFVLSVWFQTSTVLLSCRHGSAVWLYMCMSCWDINHVHEETAGGFVCRELTLGTSAPHPRGRRGLHGGSTGRRHPWGESSSHGAVGSRSAGNPAESWYLSDLAVEDGDCKGEEHQQVECPGGYQGSGKKLLQGHT